ncbi:MAG: hypothetical protein WC548_03275 [Candidatus Pacearchaeota archaeon]
MKKSGVIIILSVLLVIVVGILIYGVFQGVRVKNIINELEARNVQLEEDRAKINEDRENVLSQLDECKDRELITNNKLNLIEQDWSKIQKSCPASSGICSGKFSFMRYTCNVGGDAVNDGDKICECDQNCKLVIH